MPGNGDSWGPSMQLFCHSMKEQGDITCFEHVEYEITVGPPTSIKQF